MTTFVAMNIALLAIGKRGYHFAAYNLAASILHYDPTANILLITDDGVKYLRETDVFTQVVRINPQHTMDRGQFSPSIAKMHVDSYAVTYFDRQPYMFLDVDNVALKSLRPLWEQAHKPFEVGIEAIGSVWAKKETIAQLFGEGNYLAPHTDYWYSDGSKSTSAIFTKAIKLFPKVKPSDLVIKWGKAVPDELPLGGALMQLAIDPTPAYNRPTFLGNKSVPLTEMKADYYLMSIYGNGKGRTLTRLNYLEFYDRHMREIMKDRGRSHIYKYNFIMSDKWINK